MWSHVNHENPADSMTPPWLLTCSGICGWIESTAKALPSQRHSGHPRSTEEARNPMRVQFAKQEGRTHSDYTFQLKNTPYWINYVLTIYPYSDSVLSMEDTVTQSVDALRIRVLQRAYSYKCLIFTYLVAIAALSSSQWRQARKLTFRSLILPRGQLRTSFLSPQGFLLPRRARCLLSSLSPLLASPALTAASGS